MTATPYSDSSGDVTADRRFVIANDLAERGDLPAAADLYRQATEGAPHFVAAWFALGQTLEKLGEHRGAIEAFRQVRLLNGEDQFGALLHLQRLDAEHLQEMPQAYVRRLFDQYAARFDALLVKSLGYRGPEILKVALTEACRATARPFHFAAALDLGCGTGLAAEVFRPVVDHLVGVDLSQEMLAQAQAKGQYDRLIAGDMLTFAHASAADTHYDLVLAADAFVYLADLISIVHVSAELLNCAGMLAFTVESHDGGGVVLGKSLRYAHSVDYVQTVVGGAGLELLMLEAVSTRLEAGVPVPGLVVVARRP